MEKLVITNRLIMQNTVLNLGSRLLPAVAAIAFTPVIIRSLGMERYGILSLALVVVTYFSLFDFGLGGATTKFVAGALGQGEVERLPSLIWTSLAFIGALGLIAGLIMSLGTPLLVGRFLKIPVEFRAEAQTAFYVMSAAAPFMLVGSGLQGVLEASQRYDLVNAVNVPSSVANYLIPVAAIVFHAGLVPIAAWLVAARVVSCLAFFFLCVRVCPAIRRCVVVRPRESRSLLVFGGWLAVSNLAWPILLYLDRLVVGSVLPIAALPFYAAPCDAATRLLVLPAGWVALYPAFSAIGESRPEELAALCARGLKHLALLMGPIAIVCVCFASQIIGLWLGPQFQGASTPVFQILTAGVLANSLASVPDRLIKAIGRSDIVAQLHVAQLPFYAVLLYWAVRHWGIIGASVAWTGRALAEALIVFSISHRLVPLSGLALRRAGMTRLTSSLVVLAAAMWVAASFVRGFAQMALGAVLLAASAVFAWRCVLDRDDRESLRSALNLARVGA